MTRPTAELLWWPNRSNPLLVRALWKGAGWHYRLDFGDGTPEVSVPFWTVVPIQHAYAKAGTYILTAYPGLANAAPVRVPVTVRPEITPQFAGEPLGDGRVRLTIKGGWPGDILHRVLWGDGSAPEEYTGANLTPEHTYSAEITEATITVLDLPARRIGTVTVHVEPPPPPKGELRWWFTETGDRDRPILHVDGLRPGAVWSIYDFGLGSGRIGTGTVGGDGAISQQVELWESSTIRNHWLGFTVVEAVGGRERRIYPAYYRQWTPQGVYPVYDWYPDDPARITLRMFRPRAGTYRVDFGDGTPAESHHSDGYSLAAEHRYTNPGTARTITVTDPAGTTGKLNIQPCRLSYAGFNGRYWLDFAFGMPLPDWDHNGFVPGRADWDDGKGLLACIPVASTLNDGTKPVVRGHIYGKEHNGRQVTATVYAPWSTPVSKTVTINDGLGREFPGQLRATWTMSEQDGDSYRGEFTVTNTTTAPVSRWLLDFRLPAPAHITTVWPQTVLLQPIGGGRYAVTSTTTLDPNTSTTVGIRVEAAGDPPVQPSEVRATATQKETGMSSSWPALVAGGYVNPGRKAKLIILHLPQLVEDVKIQSDAFATPDWVEGKATGSGAERMAILEVTIAADLQPDKYEVRGELGKGTGWRPTWQLLVEPVSDGTAAVTVTTVDDKGLMHLKVEPVSRNLARGLSGNATAGVEAATEMAVGGADAWFGLVYDWSNGSAANNFVLSDKAEPGKTYDVKLKQHFHGGHSEIITGKVTLPVDPKKPVKGELPLVYHHVIDPGKLGTKDTLEHVIDFGDEHGQPNARYGVAIELVVTGPNGQKPDLTPDVRAALRDLRPLTISRQTDQVVLYGGNPPLLRKNHNFKIKLVVTITPTPTKAGYSNGDDPAAPDHAELAGTRR